MSSRDLPRVRVVAQPLHPVIIWIPLTCFIGALLTDLAYWRSAEMMWADFSAWLVSVGVLLACIAAIVVWRSLTTVEIDTFMTVLSSVITNWAEASTVTVPQRPAMAAPFRTLAGW